MHRISVNFLGKLWSFWREQSDIMAVLSEPLQAGTLGPQPHGRDAQLAISNILWGLVGSWYPGPGWRGMSLCLRLWQYQAVGDFTHFMLWISLIAVIPFSPFDSVTSVNLPLRLLPSAPGWEGLWSENIGCFLFFPSFMKTINFENVAKTTPRSDVSDKSFLYHRSNEPGGCDWDNMTPNEKITFLDLLRSSSIRLDDPVFRSSSMCLETLCWGPGDPGIVFGANITLRGSDGSCQAASHVGLLGCQTLCFLFATFLALFSFNASDVSGRFLPTVSSHPGVQVLHSCLLRCRCSALHRREVFVSYSYTLLFDEEFVVFSV